MKEIAESIGVRSVERVRQLRADMRAEHGGQIFADPALSIMTTVQVAREIGRDRVTLAQICARHRWAYVRIGISPEEVAAGRRANRSYLFAPLNVLMLKGWLNGTVKLQCGICDSEYEESAITRGGPTLYCPTCRARKRVDQTIHMARGEHNLTGWLRRAHELLMQSSQEEEMDWLDPFDAAERIRITHVQLNYARKRLPLLRTRDDPRGRRIGRRPKNSSECPLVQQLSAADVEVLRIAQAEVGSVRPKRRKK